MAVLLVRKNSDTPIVRNSDDTRMMRYATYGKSGIVKDFGDELALSKSGNNVLHIATGEIIHQGWQVTVEGAGFDIQLDNRDTVEYYTIYLEISLLIASSQTASILSLKANNAYPEIAAGDDLSENPRGTARLEIARVRLVPSSSTFEITPMLSVIDYQPTYAVNADNATYAQYASRDTSKGTIEQRLTDLGFSSGSLYVAGSGYASISSPTNSLVKQGQMVRCMLSTTITGATSNLYLTLSTPYQFTPRTQQEITIETDCNLVLRVEATTMDFETLTETITFDSVRVYLHSYISIQGKVSVPYSSILDVLESMYNKILGSIKMSVISVTVNRIGIYTGWKLN